MSETESPPEQNEEPHHGRRPILEDEEVRDALVQSLQAGNTISDSVAAIGISESSFFSWQARGRKELERLDAGEKPKKAEAPYVDFLESIKKAQFEGKQRLVTIISNAALDQWTAAAWLLERKFPREYAQRVQHTIETELDAALERLKVGLTPKEYNRALRCIAGSTGPPPDGDGSAGEAAGGPADDIHSEDEP